MQLSWVPTRCRGFVGGHQQREWGVLGLGTNCARAGLPPNRTEAMAPCRGCFSGMLAMLHDQPMAIGTAGCMARSISCLCRHVCRLKTRRNALPRASAEDHAEAYRDYGWAGGTVCDHWARSRQLGEVLAHQIRPGACKQERVGFSACARVAMSEGSAKEDGKDRRA